MCNIWHQRQKVIQFNFRCPDYDDDDDYDDADADVKRTWPEAQPDSLERLRDVAEILRPVVVLVRVKLYLNHVIQWRHVLRPLQDGATMPVTTVCKKIQTRKLSNVIGGMGPIIRTDCVQQQKLSVFQWQVRYYFGYSEIRLRKVTE